MLRSYVRVAIWELVTEFPNLTRNLSFLVRHKCSIRMRRGLSGWPITTQSLLHVKVDALPSSANSE
jgi:hypothetical protein